MQTVPPDHPSRCQGVRPGGQCTNRAQEMSNFCEACDGTANYRNQKKNILEYDLMHWNDETSTQSSRQMVKSVRDEIAILRVALQKRMQNCKDDNDLMIATPMIIDLVRQIEHAVLTCHKMEDAMGEMMDKQRLINFCDKIVNILVEENLPQAVVESISRKLMNEIN